MTNTGSHILYLSEGITFKNTQTITGLVELILVAQRILTTTTLIPIQLETSEKKAKRR